MKHTKPVRKGPPSKADVIRARTTTGAPTSAPTGRPRRTNEMPRYDSMEQMAAQAHIPIEIIKEAKKSGANFVTHDRCDLGAFLKWYFATNLSSDERENWTRRDKRASALSKEHDLDKKRKIVLERSFVLPWVVDLVGTTFCGELERMAQELPASLKGKTEVQIRDEVVRQKRSIRTMLEKKLEKFKKECNED